MSNTSLRRSHLRTHMLVGAVALAAALTALGAPAPALAGLQHEFSVFSDCPVNAPDVSTCVYSKVTGGEFTLGSKTVEITKPVVLQGGIVNGSPKLVPAADGNTLSKTPLTVPGGLVGVEGVGGEVTATAELAGTVELSAIDLLDGKGTAASLPLKVKLDNQALGEACYIASDSEPIEVELTTGTTSPPEPNKPITGNPGHFAVVNGIQVITGNSLVGNAFSVPGANGCGGLLSVAVDPAVDLSAGLPAAAGKNTAIMNGTIEQAGAREVKAQLALPEIGRCVPAESAGEGKEKIYKGAYADKGCTSEELNKEGRYEWISGPGANPKFTSTGGKATLESVSGVKVTCGGSSVAGEYTGTKALSATATFTGCVRAADGESCQSSSAAPGVIVTSALAGGLGFIEDKLSGSSLAVSVGVDLAHEPSLLSAECGGAKEALVVKGSVIAPIGKLDKMTSSFSLKYEAKVGKQAPEGFEEEPNDTLLATMGSGSEQAGLTSAEKIANEEPLEIKAEHG